MKRVLFVCMGNICRSPTAEGVFQKLVAERGLQNQIEIDSAGTIGFHEGKPADARMQKAASKRGYCLDSISRKVKPEDFENFDLIVAMDRENHIDLKQMEQSDSVAKLTLLSNYLGDEWPTDVPDPYYGGDEGFVYVVQMIEAACEPLLEELTRGIT